VKIPQLPKMRERCGGLGEVVMMLDLHRQGLTVSAIAVSSIDRKTVRECIARKQTDRLRSKQDKQEPGKSPALLVLWQSRCSKTPVTANRVCARGLVVKDLEIGQPINSAECVQKLQMASHAKAKA
jgi:hypothetical protein